MSVVLILELLLKSSLIAGAGLALSAVLHRRPAADRVDILRATVCLLIALPAVMAIAPGLPLALLPAVAAAEAIAASPIAWAGAVEPVEGVALSGSILWPSGPDLVLWAWAIGAGLVLGRFALGVWTLRRWTRDGQGVAAAAWTAPLERISAARRPRLVASAAVSAPLSWGIPPGVVLIGHDQLARPETARAVLAHELAHLRRGDWIFLVMSRMALGLFWFNPLAWGLHAALSARSEEAADAEAVGELDRKSYARALIDLATEFNPPAALGMAGPAETLNRRIACIMKTSAPLRRRPVAMALTIGALIGVATPISALELIPHGQPSLSAPLAPLAALDPVDAVDSVALPAPAVDAVEPADAAAAVDAVAPVAAEVDWFEGQDAYPVPPPPPPVPPLPPAPHVAMMAPPAPPAPPAPAGRALRASGGIDRSRALTQADRQALVEARQAAVEARIQARESRLDAQRARAEVRARAVNMNAEQAQTRAGIARERAERNVAGARVNMTRGADQMAAGAARLREQSALLRDPAYRATRIERARERGQTVSDAELQAMSPRLETRAVQLERRAVELRERAARQLS